MKRKNNQNSSRIVNSSKTRTNINIFRVISAFVMCFVIIFTLTSCGKEEAKPSDETKTKIVAEEKQSEEKEDNKKEETQAEQEDTNAEEKEENVTEEKDSRGSEDVDNKKGSDSQVGSQTSTVTKTSNTSTTKATTNNTTAHVHKYSIFVKTVAPTATEKGYDIYQCSCGATTKANYKDVIKNTTPTRDYNEASAFLNALNNYRKSKGLSTLKVEGFMQEYAMKRANELVSDYSHNGNSRSRALTNCPEVDCGEYGMFYTYSFGGENIDITFSNNASNIALTEFKNSPDHEKNQTNSKWTHVGIGCVKYNDCAYFAVEFYYENDLCFD